MAKIFIFRFKVIKINFQKLLNISKNFYKPFKLCILKFFIGRNERNEKILILLFCK